MKKLKEEWGGYREGSGRKPSEEPKERVSLMLSVKSVQKIERLRKEKNRSQFVDDLIKEL